MENIAIVGSGTMGNGIAQVFATKGYMVQLIDVSPDALRLAEMNINKNLDRFISKGKLSFENKPALDTTVGILVVMVHPELFHLSVEIRSLHPHAFGGQRHVFIACFDLLLDVPNLEIIRRLSQRL